MVMISVFIIFTTFDNQNNHQRHLGMGVMVVDAFTTPTLGLGAVLFPPKGLVTESARGDISSLLEASDFFVDAFWSGKVGGGAKQLDDRQRRQLSSLQFSEFRARYAGIRRGQAELILCTAIASGDELIGCAGIEVSSIPTKEPKGTQTIRAPLMSNVAVSQKYRRRGIGEKLVAEAERIARYEWGFTDCYLYVEERNRAAVKLYQKLGYRRLWVDQEAKTLLPQPNGKLAEDSTRIVCMRKRLDLGILGRFWPF